MLVQCASELSRFPVPSVLLVTLPLGVVGISSPSNYPSKVSQKATTSEEGLSICGISFVFIKLPKNQWQEFIPSLLVPNWTVHLTKWICISFSRLRFRWWIGTETRREGGHNDRTDSIYLPVGLPGLLQTALTRPVPGMNNIRGEFCQLSSNWGQCWLPVVELLLRAGPIIM